MHRRLSSLVFVFTLCLAVPAWAGEKLLAVLPLDVAHAKGKMDADARVSVEEMLRDVAADTLASAGWTVMTGETTLQLLIDNGLDPSKCGDTSCHLSAARELTASKFISGSVQWVDGEFVASIRLIDTASGRILSSARLEGSTTRSLRKEFEGKATEFFTKSGLLDEKTTTVVTPAGKTSIKVASEPPGATVRIDGEIIGKTPIKHPIDAGTYYVTIELEGFSPTTKQIEIESGHEATIFERLLKTAGFVDIAVTPATAHISVDGTPAGSGKQGPFPIGAHKVRAEAPGYAPIEQAVEVENGTTTPLQLTLTPLPGKLLVQVNVDAECEAAGIRVHAAPSTVTVMSVPPGTLHVACARDGYVLAGKDVTVDPGKAAPVVLTLAKDDVPRPGKVRKDQRSGLDFVYLPGGSFHYGCEPQDTQCLADEQPGRTAQVAVFWLGKTEVTTTAYARCVAAGVCAPESNNLDACNRDRRPDHPANCLDVDQARKFCEWLGGRLPTSEEWEFAAKSGESRIHPWGDEPVDGQRANFCDKNCPQASADTSAWADMTVDDGWAGTSPPGSFPRGTTKWGLVDMVGNVWEWTASKYDDANQEIRGAGWYDHASRLRNSHRLGVTSSTRAFNLGFRCLQPK